MLWVLVRGSSHAMESCDMTSICQSTLCHKLIRCSSPTGQPPVIVAIISSYSVHSSANLALSPLRRPLPEATPSSTLPFLSDQEGALVCCKRDGKLGGTLNRYIVGWGWRRAVSAGCRSGRMSCWSPDACGSCSMPVDPGASASTYSEESGWMPVNTKRNS